MVTAFFGLKKHPRSKVEIAIRKVSSYSDKLNISEWIKLEVAEREIKLGIDKDILKKQSQLDGCYVLKTDLTEKEASKEIIHGRYKDLALVEKAFRTCKTVELEMRPINVRLERRTKGHAFVVMVGYMIVKELSQRWADLNVTVEEGIKELSTLCLQMKYV